MPWLPSRSWPSAIGLIPPLLWKMYFTFRRLKIVFCLWALCPLSLTDCSSTHTGYFHSLCFRLHHEGDLGVACYNSSPPWELPAGAQPSLRCSPCPQCPCTNSMFLEGLSFQPFPGPTQLYAWDFSPGCTGATCMPNPTQTCQDFSHYSCPQGRERSLLWILGCQL